MQTIVSKQYPPESTYPTVREDIIRLADLSLEERKAIRMYVEAALADLGYYEPLLSWLGPLLEYIQDSRHEVSPEVLQASLEMHRNLLQELCDRVFSRTMARIIRNDGKLEPNKRAELALRVESCGTVLGYNQCPDGHRKLQKSLCGMPKYCRRCSRIEAYKRAEALYERTAPILSRMPTGYEFRFVTVTSKPSGDLRADAELVIGAWAKTYRGLFKDDCSAAWRRIEVGAESGMVHVHALVLSPFVPVAELSDYWEKRTGAPVVHIEAVRGRKELKRTCYEVSKYATDHDKHIERHGLEQGIQSIYEMGYDLRRLKLSQTYGMFRADVFERRMGEPPPEPKEQDPCRCDICGNKWVEYVELHEPRGSPVLKVVGKLGY